MIASRALALALLLGAACGDDDAGTGASSTEATPCRADDDCPGELSCVRYQCATPAQAAKAARAAKARGGRLPSTEGVTPEAVKRELDGISQGYERKLDRALDP